MTPLAIAPAQAVKERPILFSGPMVQALLAGEKTQTRRIVKGAPQGAGCVRVVEPWSAPQRVTEALFFKGSTPESPGVGLVKCPYGSPEERLWARETFTRGVLPVTAEGGSQLKRGPVVTEGRFADDWQQAAWYDGTDDPWGWFSERKRIPSIFMPRWASRLTLEITEVRVERLQAISEADAWAEGITQEQAAMGSAVGAFSVLWDQINSEAHWVINPWVWAVSFKVVPQ